MQRPLLSPTELAMSTMVSPTSPMELARSPMESATSTMGSEATPLCTLPLPLPRTTRLPRPLLWLFTTITHQHLLPIMPPLLLPMPLLFTTMSPSHTPPMPSPMELEAALTVRFISTRTSPTATSTSSPTPRRTTTSKQLSRTTGLGCEADPTPSPCRTRGSSTWFTTRMRTGTSPPSPTRALPSTLTLSELGTGITQGSACLCETDGQYDTFNVLPNIKPRQWARKCPSCKFSVIVYSSV